MFPHTISKFSQKLLLPESALDTEIISRIILTMNESPLWVKTSQIPVRTLYAKCWPFKYWWSTLSSKVCKKIQVRSS